MVSEVTHDADRDGGERRGSAKRRRGPAGRDDGRGGGPTPAAGRGAGTADPGRAAPAARRHGPRPAGRPRRAARPLHPRDAEAMRVVFADTFYFLALLNPTDQAHVKAVTYTRSFRDRMVTDRLGDYGTRRRAGR